MKVAFVATKIPRRCGIATYTEDLRAAVQAADPAVRTVHAAIDEASAVRAYSADVRWRIRQGDPESYRAAATALNGGGVDVVNLQHEFGLYGAWKDDVFDDHLRPFLDELRVPLVATLHSLPPEPSDSMRDAIRAIAGRAEVVVVMAQLAARLLAERYGVATRPVVIPHGMPAIARSGRHRLKRQLGIAGRTVISTFGLVDPRKGLEYMIEAMPEIVERFPSCIYLIVGQTHPELLRSAGEAYRNELVARVTRLGLGDHVGFVNQYLTQREIVDHLLASDVYVTPYLDPNQITSGTLAYALGAGKAIVSTRYLHAIEALADDRGLLVDFRSAAQLATGVLVLLSDPARKEEMERRAYAYGAEAAWPAVGRHTLELMRDVVAQHPRTTKRSA
ncbi:MAG TPA: glycosyltransferase family 4 protein [Candidatus Saccharimonadales bacterium]|nr:glycosyltransferase family 4 protein [Candidatus Saccharimonadales bacterium]